MPQIPLPEGISSDLYDTLRALSDALDDMEIPLLHDQRSLNNLSNDQSAYYQDGNKLFLYTRTNNVLHRVEYDVEQVAQVTAEPSARNYSSELG